MSLFDIEKLTAEVSAEAPCGEDLSYDPAYAQLEEESKGKPERAVGDSVIPATSPDWQKVLDQSHELLGRTKDLRVCVYLTRAALELGGLYGLCDGLELTRRLLESYWDEIHPQLDPEDEDPADFRINALEQLADNLLVLKQVRAVPLFEVGGRSLSLRDILLAGGELEPAGNGEDEIIDQALVEGILADTDVETVKEKTAAAEKAKADCTAIEAVFEEKIDAQSTPDLSPLREAFDEVLKELNKCLLKRGYGSSEGEAEAEHDEAGGVSGGKTGPPSTGGPISSREDVIRAIDEICSYYRRNEPSSPVPLLLGDRCREPFGRSSRRCLSITIFCPER